MIAAIWEEVLRRDGIGVEDNFFEIGGHSLLATQIASRLREHFRHSGGGANGFRGSHHCRNGAQTRQRAARGAGTGSAPIKPVPREYDLPLSFAQERLWVLDQMEPNNPLYNIPRSLRLKGALQVVGAGKCAERNRAAA